MCANRRDTKQTRKAPLPSVFPFAMALREETKQTSLGLFHQLAIRSATLKRRDLLHTLHRHGIKKDDERIKVRPEE